MVFFSGDCGLVDQFYEFFSNQEIVLSGLCRVFMALEGLVGLCRLSVMSDSEGVGLKVFGIGCKDR